MNNIIVLNFQDRNFNTGFTVTLLFGDKTDSEISAFLPRSLQMFQSFQEWWESSDHKRSSCGISAKSGIKTFYYFL
jgi:hypothetical protein